MYCISCSYVLLDVFPPCAITVTHVHITANREHSVLTVAPGAVLQQVIQYVGKLQVSPSCMCRLSGDTSASGTWVQVRRPALSGNE